MAEGALIEVAVAREIVPNVNLISAAMRNAGWLNVFLRCTYDGPSRSPGRRGTAPIWRPT
jgi:ureidoacrylate peracid hydrolase